MPLANMKDLIAQAQLKGVGCGSFSVGNMEMVLGAVQAAEELNTPIIIQIAEVRLKHSPLALMAPMMMQAAENAKVDVAVHLDHGLTLSTIRQALDYGFTSVMLDKSKLALEENIAETTQIVRLAKSYGAAVEAELGMVGGSEDGSEDHAVRYTNPAEAKRFCTETGVDALAVAIGNAHGLYTAAPNLAFDVLSEIEACTNVPLVLHGGSGISDDDFRRAVSLGIGKVNIATASFNSLTQAAKAYFSETESPDYFGLNEAMVFGTYSNVKHHIEVFNHPWHK